LGDERKLGNECFKLRKRTMCRIRLDVIEYMPTMLVPLPDTLGIGKEAIHARQFFWTES